jgi:hypothetical protein
VAGLARQLPNRIRHGCQCLLKVPGQPMAGVMGRLILIEPVASGLAW